MIPTGPDGLPMAATYDNDSTGSRESYFHGRLTAVWDEYHLKQYPWGTFPPIPAGFARVGRELCKLSTQQER